MRRSRNGRNQFSPLVNKSLVFVDVMSNGTSERTEIILLALPSLFPRPRRRRSLSLSLIEIRPSSVELFSRKEKKKSHHDCSSIEHDGKKKKKKKRKKERKKSAAFFPLGSSSNGNALLLPDVELFLPLPLSSFASSSPLFLLFTRSRPSFVRSLPHSLARFCRER